MVKAMDKMRYPRKKGYAGRYVRHELGKNKLNLLLGCVFLLGHWGRAASWPGKIRRRFCPSWAASFPQRDRAQDFWIQWLPPLRPMPPCC